MSQDTWVGIAIGGLSATFVWGLAVLVVIAAIGVGRHDVEVDGRKFTGDGSDSDDQ